MVCILTCTMAFPKCCIYRAYWYGATETKCSRCSFVKLTKHFRISSWHCQGKLLFCQSCLTLFTFKYLQPFIVCGVKEESVFNFQFSSHKPVLSGRWACSECRPTTLVQQCLNQIDNVMLFMVEVRCKQKNSISNSRRVLFKMYFFKSLLKIEPNYCL